MNKLINKITPLDSWIRLKICPENKILKKEDLSFYQLKKICETVSIARGKSIFYKNHLAGSAESEIYSMNDFIRFPFTDEEDVRRYGNKMLCVQQDEISRIVTLESSGTNGIPKRLYFTDSDREHTIDFFMHGMSTLAGTGDRVLILLPFERPGSVGDLLACAVKRLGAVPFMHGIVKNPFETLNLISENRINTAVGVPVQFNALAEFYSLDNKKAVALERILLSTDYLPAATTAKLERVFGCEVYDHYGMTEMGLGGGIECSCHCGYHLREADLYFEIINPESGEPAAEGEYGEIVVTTLTRTGMPLIRYRTGDISRFIPGDCMCGSVLRRMERVRKRQNGSIILGSGNKLSMSEFDERLFKINGVVDFEIACIISGSRNRVEIEITAFNHLNIESEAGDSLLRIPGVSECVQNGTLEISVKIKKCSTGYIPLQGKRKIKFLNNKSEKNMSDSVYGI